MEGSNGPANIRIQILNTGSIPVVRFATKVIPINLTYLDNKLFNVGSGSKIFI